MKTRSFAILLFFSLVISMNSCKTDEAATPAAASVSVDRTTTNLATPVTFTISEVSASAVTLFPYGTENGNLGSVAVTFTNGSAVIPFTYSKVGTWNAVVITNNNTTDPRGKVSVKNTPSQILSIKVGNNRARFSKFNVDKTTSRKVALDTANKVVNDTIPWDPSATGFQIVSNYTADAFAKVFVGTTEQTSGTTKNDFSSTVTYTVKSENGLQSTPYTVHVYMTPAETNYQVKTVKGSYAGFVDNPNKNLVLYRPYSDSVKTAKFGYALSGNFSIMKYGGKKLKQDSLLDLTTSKTVVVFAQDSTTQSYALYGAVAPKLTLGFDPSIPITDVSTLGPAFSISFQMASSNYASTLIKSLKTFTITAPPAGVTVNSIWLTLPDQNPTLFTSGSAVDFSKPVKFTLKVHDANIGGVTGVDYDVVYTASVAILK